jgi:BioD-like phosphotransacetylase family protein
MPVQSIYITSVERFSGKTATILALGKHLQADGFAVGYLKPLSLQPWWVAGKIADEDATFVKEILGLALKPWELSPVVVTPEFLQERLQASLLEKNGAELDLMEKVLSAFKVAGAGKDILLLEGGGSLREGHAVRLPTPEVARALSSCVIVIVKYRSDVRLLDDALSALARMQDSMCGAIINRVPPEAAEFVSDLGVPFLEKRGVPVFGVLPEVGSLAALTVGELIEVVDARVLTEKTDPQARVETLTVGAMTAETALHRFREQVNKAVITGGDRTDIQLAALETSTTCLILTGNLHPSPLIVKQAESMGVAVLLVRDNTMETVEAIERVFGKSRLGQEAKLVEFQELFEKHVDFEKLYKIIGIKRD